MNEDVVIKLTLDGDEKVRSGLKGVGDSAEDSDGKLGRLVSGGLKGVAIGAAALATGVALAGKGLWEVAQGAAEAGDRVDKLSDKLGMSVQGFQEWDYIMSQNGINIESLRGSMQRLAVGIDEARSGTGPAAEAFDRLGLSMSELEGQSREQQFETTVRALQGVTDETERAAIAQDLLGRGATELMPLLNAGADSIENLKEEAHRLGLIMSEEAVQASVQFQDSLDALQRTVSGVRNTLGAQLLPGLVEVNYGLADLIAGVDGAEDRIRDGAQAFSDDLSEVLPKILDVLSTVLEGVAIIAPQIISSLVAGISSNLPTLIGTVSSSLVSLIGLLAAQAPVFVQAGVQAILALVSGVTSALPTLIPAVIKGVLGVVRAIIGAAPMLLDAGLQLILGLADGILEAIPVIIEMLPTLIDGIVSFIESGVPLLLDAGIQLFMGIVDALPTIISQLIAVLPGMITAIIGAIVGAVPLLVQAGITLLVALVQALPQIITTIVAALPSIITAILNAIIGSLPLLVQAGIDLFVALIGALPQIITTIVGALPKIITAVVDALIGAIPQLIQAGIQLFVAIIQNMPAILAGIVGAIPQIISGIVGAIVGAVPELAKAGLRLIQGLWQGISDAAGWLLNKIGGFVDQVMGGIKDFFGIASPARRLRVEVGANLPSGIGLGVEDKKMDAIQPIRRLNADILAEAQKLDTTVAFTHDTTVRQTLVPMQATPTSSGPIQVQASIDPSSIVDALVDALISTGDQEQMPVTLSQESIDRLATAVVDSVQVQSRQGVVVLD